MEIEPRYLSAYRFYQRCKAVRRFPEDDLVEWAAGLFLQAEESAERTWRKRDLETVSLDVARILRKS